ncbi:MAG: DUF6514 family protein [Oscillospiraceae bacterium]
MNEVYFDVVGNKRYSVFENKSDDTTMYNVAISEDDVRYMVNDFSSNKKKAVEFAELLIRNYVSAIHINDIAYDFLS